MDKQRLFEQEKKKQETLHKVKEFDPRVVKKHKKDQPVEVTDTFSIVNDGGERFNLFLEETLKAMKDEIIAKTIELSDADLERLRLEGIQEAEEFIQTNKKS